MKRMEQFLGKVNFQIKHIKYQSFNVIKLTLMIGILEILKCSIILLLFEQLLQN